MASWKENMGRMAQNAVSKSKEMAEISRLNREISSIRQKMQTLYAQTGEYLMANPERVDASDEVFAGKVEQLSQLKEQLEAANKSLLEVRNVQLCPGCGAEVDHSGRFCGRCGAELPVSEPQPAPAQPEHPVCPGCGAAVDPESAFCGSCGARLGQDPAAAPAERTDPAADPKASQLL